MSLEYEKETYMLRRCFFEVQNEVGAGRQEETYHQACALWFHEHGLPVTSKQPHRLFVSGQEAHRLFPDFVAWNAISIELKAVPRHLNRGEFVQLFDYLKCRKDRLGLLVNMGLDRVEIERVVYDAPNTEWIENWDAWSNQSESNDRAISVAVREALNAVCQEHTTGYGSEVLIKLAQCALRQRGLGVSLNPMAKACFRGIEIYPSPLSCMIINDRVLLTLTALFETNDLNISRGKSYLQALGLESGVAADFGRKRAVVAAIRSPPTT